MKLLYKIIFPIKIFIYAEFYGCNFLLRKLPYIGILFWPLEILSLPRIKDTKGTRLRKLFIKLGPAYIKLGQLLSTKPDLVGVKIAQQLSSLQDRLPYFPEPVVKRILIKEFCSDYKNIFKEFNYKAEAAASIAQIHKAKLKNGEIVAVKILRPKIKQRFLKEISALYFIVTIINFFPSAKRLKLKSVIKTLENSTRKELDLRYEAASASKLADNLANNKNIIIPKIHWELISSNIIVMEWIEGEKITNLGKKRDLETLSNNLIIAFYEQAYRDGFFHADIHFGNILITKENKIALLDFGIMGELSKRDRIFVAQIIYGFIKRDYDLVANIHHQAGYIPKSSNINDFALACRSIGEPIFGRNVSNISIAKLLIQLFAITKDFGMETQPQLLLLQKTLLMTEAVGRELNPELNMWELGKPWMQNWAQENLSAKARIRDKFLELKEILEL